MLARRRRAAAIGLTACVTAGLLLTTGGGSGPASVPDAPTAVTLSSGDTLWGLAQSYAAPGVDLRAYVDEIVSLNSLRGTPQVGQKVVLPR